MTTFEDLYRARSAIEELPDEAIDPYAVMPAQCVSCPWRSNGGILAHDREAFAALQASVITKANQRCHGRAIAGLLEDKICRGARDYQLLSFWRMGVLREPTDGCYRETLERLKGGDRS